MSGQSDYLRDELYARIQTSPKVFDFIQSIALDGIWYWDLERPDNTWISPEFKALFGYQDHEAPNKGAWWQSRLDPTYLESMLSQIKQHAARPESPYDSLARYFHRDGSDVWVRCRAIVFYDTSGVPTRVLGCHTDVTELRTAQLELESKVTELSRVNVQLDRFAAAMSHDLQEPLRKLSMFGSRLGDELKTTAQLSPKTERYLQEMAATTGRMSAMLQDVLEYSRYTQADLPKQQIDLDALIADVQSDLAALIEQSGAQIQVDPLPHHPAKPRLRLSVDAQPGLERVKIHQAWPAS